MLPYTPPTSRDLSMTSSQSSKRPCPLPSFPTNKQTCCYLQKYTTGIYTCALPPLLSGSNTHKASIRFHRKLILAHHLFCTFWLLPMTCSVTTSKNLTSRIICVTLEDMPTPDGICLTNKSYLPTSRVLQKMEQ